MVTTSTTMISRERFRVGAARARVESDSQGHSRSKERFREDRSAMLKQSDADMEIGKPLHESFLSISTSFSQPRHNTMRYRNNSRPDEQLLMGRIRPGGAPAIDCRTHATVPNNQPTPDVIAMASAPQKVTRIAPDITLAPPACAASPPRSARNSSDVPATRGIRPAP